jgi:hypothetical protein
MLYRDVLYSPQPLPFGLACQPDLASSYLRRVKRELDSYPYLTLLEGFPIWAIRYLRFIPLHPLRVSLQMGIRFHLVTTRGRNFTYTNIELSRFIELSLLWLLAANPSIYC